MLPKKEVLISTRSPAKASGCHFLGGFHTPLCAHSFGKSKDALPRTHIGVSPPRSERVLLDVAAAPSVSWMQRPRQHGLRPAARQQQRHHHRCRAPQHHHIASSRHRRQSSLRSALITIFAVWMLRPALSQQPAPSCRPDCHNLAARPAALCVRVAFMNVVGGRC